MSKATAPKDDFERPGLSWLRDAKPLVDRLELLHRTLRSSAGRRTFELYHRSAVSLRLGLQEGKKTLARRVGVDEGLALRTLSDDGREISFAASSGSGKESLQWALEQSRDSRGRIALENPWARDGNRRTSDREPDLRLPAADELSNWLARARDELAGTANRRGATPEPLEAWIEVAATAESWVADGGLRALRTRARGWGMLRMRDPWGAGSPFRPVLIARRRWEELPTTAWSAVLEDRWVSPRPKLPPPTRPLPVLFNPECAAILVLALVKALHIHEPDGELPVGPAWRVVDEPGHSAALFGGSFDDAGFATDRTLLADGQRAVGKTAGAGHLRRPSFRDRPISMPSHLTVLTEGNGSPPPRGVLVTALTVHPLEPDHWMLEIDGAHLEGGRPGPVLRSAIVTVSPRELVRRCVAAVGPARLSHLGVETPALVFDNLTLR